MLEFTAGIQVFPTAFCFSNGTFGTPFRRGNDRAFLSGQSLLQFPARAFKNLSLALDACG
jgi:hypothetical protein